MHEKYRTDNNRNMASKTLTKEKFGNISNKTK